MRIRRLVAPLALVIALLSGCGARDVSVPVTPTVSPATSAQPSTSATSTPSAVAAEQRPQTATPSATRAATSSASAAPTATATPANPAARQCIKQGTPGPSVRSTGIAEVDTVIRAVIDGDCLRLATLVTGRDWPCDALAGMPKQFGIDCPTGAPLGTPRKVVSFGGCGVDHSVVTPERAALLASFFMEDVTDMGTKAPNLAGVLRVKNGAIGYPGEHYVAFESPGFGIQALGVDPAGIVSFFAPGCRVEVKPTTLAGVVSAYRDQAELVFVP